MTQSIKFTIDNGRGQTIHLSPATVVFKVGSNVLCDASGRLEAAYIQRLSDTICDFVDRGAHVVLVSSGAIAAGLGVTGRSRATRSISENQALAAIGQSQLMREYTEAFQRRGRQVAQILLTRLDLEDRARYLNARRAIEALFAMGVIPIINENDTTAVDEIKFGGNDILSAIVAAKLKADLLILLTNVDGVFDRNPHKYADARLIPVIDAPRDLKSAITTQGQSPLGTGGMESKIQGAILANDAGVCAIIANGRGEQVLEDLARGRPRGSVFIAHQGRRLSSWSNWILSANRDGAHRVLVDDGARRALIEGKKSLLPAGVRETIGTFGEGEVVDIADPSGEAFARGITNYSSEELQRIKGLRTERIEQVLGYSKEHTVIHRDNLIVLKEK